MSARRTLIIIVAIAIGAVAAISTVLYVNSVQSRADNNARLVGVYVVAKTIPKGTTGSAAIDANAIKSSRIPKQFYPASAETNIDDIKGLVAPNDIPVGQILVDNMFVEPKVAQTSFSGTNIPAGQMAITINLDATHAAGGLIVPGDKIDLMAIFQPEDKSGAPIPPADQTKYAHFFYQNVKVIAIGSEAAPTPGQTSTPAAAASNASSLYTVAVPPEAAERIILAANEGSLYAALVPPNNQPVTIPAVPGSAIDAANPALAGPPALTPEGQ